MVRIARRLRDGHDFKDYGRNWQRTSRQRAGPSPRGVAQRVAGLLTYSMKAVRAGAA